MKDRKQILIIEDHEESRFLYSELLRSENFDVVEAEHGKEALEYLSNHDIPNLIVMDLTFPLMTAKEFSIELRKKSEHAAIPLLIVSGQWDIEEQSKELGAVGFVKKPFDVEPFLEAIKKFS